MKPATLIQVQECTAGARRHAAKSLIGLIGMGLYMLKANALFAAPNAGRRTVQRVAQLSLSEENATEGFGQWLAEAFEGAPFQVSLRSAYNYMRAASRMGLTAESTEADLAALEESNALEGKTAKQLYAPESDGGSEGASHTPPDAGPEQLYFNFEAAVSDFVAPESIFLRNLPKLPLAKLTAYEASLQAALAAVREAQDAVRKGGK